MSLEVTDLRVYYRTLAGRVVLDGVELPITDTDEMDHFRFGDISIIPQYAMSALNPTRKIGKMVAELVESRRRSFRELREELDRRVALVGLTPDVLDRYPIELSGGMKQRMVMVISTLLNPSLLIADEIISMLDASTRIDVLNLLGDLKEQGVGILFITHDLSLGNYISDTTLIMRRGCIVEMGATEKVFGKPAHPYTQMLLTSVPHLTERWQPSAHTPTAEDEFPDGGPLIRLEDDHFAAIGGDA